MLPPPPPPPPAPPPPPIASVETKVPEPPPPPPEPPQPAVTLELGEASPTPPKPTPVVRITAPARGATIDPKKTADFAIKLDVKNWKTAPSDAHVHLILDNRPYKPIYDTKSPIKMKELLGNDELTSGRHTLVAFPSRANHESVKTPGAVAIVDFWVGKKEKVKVDVTKQPRLIYSRPKGEYKGDMATRVLVDFQLLNVELAEGKSRVHISVEGPGIDGSLSKTTSSFGAPYYLEHLRKGDYTLKLELVDQDDKPVDGDWNSTTRTIHTEPEDHESAAPHAH